MTLRNPSSQPQNVQISFSGGVWEERVSEVRKNYAAEVRYVDQYVGQLWDRLSQLGLLNKTIIVVVADHGEGLKTHGILGHVDKLWNETLHIPFIIYYPRLGYKGKRVEALVNTLDIMPTILDLLHIKNTKPMEGISLKRYISRSPVDQIFSNRRMRTWTYGCTFTPEAAHDSFAITDGKLKVIHTPNKRGWQWEAYDLTQDPIEKKNISRFDPQRFNAMATMKGLLEGHRKEAQSAHERRKNPVLSPEEQQMLRNLGYVGGEDKEEQPQTNIDEQR
jgi:arylsulfatase A-like enzyme